MQNIHTARRQGILLKYIIRERETNNIETNVNNTNEEEPETYQLSTCNGKTTQNAPQFPTTLKNDFMRQVSINNNIAQILTDTGTKVLVCGVKQPSQAKIHPYNLQPISIKGTALLIEFFILPGSCQLILDGFKAA